MCGVCFALFAVVSSAAGPFDGKWNAHVVRPAPAGPQDLIITLNSGDDGKVTGSLAIQGGGESPIEWGMIKGDLIAFKVKMPFQTSTQTFVYLGKIEGDRISFGRRPEDLTLGRLVEFTATKAK
jgi:hypothetical protein